MNAIAITRGGVNAECLAGFDLSIVEQLKHAKEMRGRHQHDAMRLAKFGEEVAARQAASESEVTRLDHFIAMLEAMKSSRQLTGSVVAGGSYGG